MANDTDNTTTAPALTAAAGYAAKLERAKSDLMQSRRDLMSIEFELENKRKAIRILEVDVKTYELLAEKESNASMTRDEYAKLKASGMMWELHPEFTGSYEADILSHTSKSRNPETIKGDL
jgi:hypothetical protein